MYRVVWEWDSEAESPREAALEALEAQRRKDSIATYFDVYDEAGALVTSIDFWEGKNKLSEEEVLERGWF